MSTGTSQAAVATTDDFADPRLKDAIRSFVTGYSVEVTPQGAAKVEDFRTLLRPGTSIYITFLPGSELADTISTAKRLRREGFNPVPHLAARSMYGKNILDEGLARLVGEAGVTEVLCIGGALKAPAGEFSDTMQMLATGLFDKHGIRRIGVAGHPEGSPDIPEAAILEALKWKNAFAARTGAELYIATQFCFEAAPIIAWDTAIQAAGNRLPVRIGIPGVATIKTLVAYAKSCGIGPSMAFVSKQARNIAKLMSLSAPDRLIADIAAYRRSDPKCGIVGCHMFPFGGLKKTAAWTHAVVDGNFVLNPKGGFRLTADLA
ncbi:MAG: metFprotein [Rhodospirillales bacterium]|nr:metFprotein [Rhodospirillales bacterium]